ncbi:MAG: helix-turn-helix domain-containing protein [Chloroflexota bacterium]
MSKISLEVPDIYSVSDAAKEIGVHFTTIYRWVRWSLDLEGDRFKPPLDIRPFRIGEQIYLTAEDVKALKAEVKNDHDHAGNKTD